MGHSILSLSLSLFRLPPALIYVSPPSTLSLVSLPPLHPPSPYSPRAGTKVRFEDSRSGSRHNKIKFISRIRGNAIATARHDLPLIVSKHVCPPLLCRCPPPPVTNSFDSWDGRQTVRARRPVCMRAPYASSYVCTRTSRGVRFSPRDFPPPLSTVILPLAPRDTGEIRHCIPVTRLPSPPTVLPSLPPAPSSASRFFSRELARPPRLNTCQHVGWHRFFAEIENLKNKTSRARPEREADRLRRVRKRMRGRGSVEDARDGQRGDRDEGERKRERETASLYRNQFVPSWLTRGERGGPGSPFRRRARRCSGRV